MIAIDESTTIHALIGKDSSTDEYLWLMTDETTFVETCKPEEAFQTPDWKYAEAVMAKQPKRYKMFIQTYKRDSAGVYRGIYHDE